MSKVLITGGLGFIGSHLARHLLADGHEVDVLDNGARGSVDGDIEQLRRNDRYRLFLGDLRDPDCLNSLRASYATIYHLAAVVGVRNVTQRPFDVLDSNVATLVRTLAFARRQDSLRRFVFASTSEVYAGTLHYFDAPIPTPEETPLTVSDLHEPRSSYMLSKLYGEALCHHAGVPYTIIRPHNVYGPRMGMAHVIPELLMRAHQSPARSQIEVFSPDHRRTFCYIDDAVELIARLAAAPAGENETFNVGSCDDETSIADLSELVFAVVGKGQTMRPGPETAGSPPRRKPKMSRTLAVTGYTPAVTLEDGVRQTYHWYRGHAFETAAA